MRRQESNTRQHEASRKAVCKSVKVGTPVDADVRRQVLDTSQSFILQAPAGSGKTELLTQRFLALLSQVDQPEKIVAITFTRKAAAEMKQRITESLRLAGQPQPEKEPENTRWQLARKAMEQSQRCDWELENNPGRLQVTTIDSLCAKIIALQPMLSQIGAMPELSDKAEPLYAEAVERLLSRIDDDEPVSDSLRKLLLYKDIQLDQLKEMLQRMLAKRLQWLIPDTRTDQPWQTHQLLPVLQELIHDRLNWLDKLVPVSIRSSLPEIFQYIGHNLGLKDEHWQEKKPYLARAIMEDQWRTEDHARLIQYKAMSEVVLTASGKRKFLSKVTAKQGVPAVNKKLPAEEQEKQQRMKQSFESILAEMQSTEGLLEALLELACLPELEKDDAQIEILQAVLSILPYAAAELVMLFSERNVVDYAALNWGALQALQEEDSPTELALMLDYKIEHLLIDEFQDTSTPQIRLLKQLTAAWDESDNKTLFLVGDPMQSIYRFRDANVGIFMSIAEQGLENIKPKYLKLAQNFRSSQAIVDWVNQRFAQIMPSEDDIANGAVSYSPATAFHQAEKTDGVFCEAWCGDNEQTSEQLVAKVVDAIKQHLANNKKERKLQSLAVLGQSRKQLSLVASALRRSGISFQGIELEPIKDVDSVRELTNLALALSNPWIDLYWAALLRSPAFGLSQTQLADIFCDAETCLPDAISRIHHWMTQQPADSFIRQQWTILQQTLQQRGRKPFAKWLLGCYYALTGCEQRLPQSVLADLTLAASQLASVVEKGDYLDQDTAEEALDGLYAAPDPDADEQIQLMTMHKSKGLEFDTVILPLMSHHAPSNTELLRWGDFINEKGEPHFVFAVSQESGKEKPAVYRWLEYIDQKKSAFELQRLLYVAATRAKKQLLVFTQLTRDNKSGEHKAPNESSLGGLLWPHIEGDTRIHMISSAEPLETIDEPLVDEDEFLQTSYYWQFNPKWLQEAQTKGRHQLLAACLPEVELVQEKEPITSWKDESGKVETFNDAIEPDIAATQGVLIHWLLEEVTGQIANPLSKDIQQHQACAEKAEQTHVISADNLLEGCWGKDWHAKLRRKAEDLLPFAEEDLIKSSAELAVTALNRMLADDFGYQILTARQGAAEQTLIKSLPLGVLNRIVDRTFVEGETRFIVDYKTATPQSGQSMTQFLRQQGEEYQTQLEDYANLYRQMENRKIVAGLYFPLIAEWLPLVDLAPGGAS